MPTCNSSCLVCCVKMSITGQVVTIQKAQALVALRYGISKMYCIRWLHGTVELEKWSKQGYRGSQVNCFCPPIVLTVKHLQGHYHQATYHCHGNIICCFIRTMFKFQFCSADLSHHWRLNRGSRGIDEKRSDVRYALWEARSDEIWLVPGLNHCEKVLKKSLTRLLFWS